MAIENEVFIALAADIVAAYVSNNAVASADVGGMIQNVYGALEKLGAPVEAVQEKPTGAVSIRASVKPEYLVSMIDGKRYKMLKRHLALNGYTPQSYREAFALPQNYPMVCADYAAKRRQLAMNIGLGRKAKSSPEAVIAAKPARKPRAKKLAPLEA
jgi:predicted transcriptional regulator